MHFGIPAIKGKYSMPEQWWCTCRCCRDGVSLFRLHSFCVLYKPWRKEPMYKRTQLPVVPHEVQFDHAMVWCYVRTDSTNLLWREHFSNYQVSQSYLASLQIGLQVQVSACNFRQFLVALTWILCESVSVTLPVHSARLYHVLRRWLFLILVTRVNDERARALALCIFALCLCAILYTFIVFLVLVYIHEHIHIHTCTHT